MNIIKAEVVTQTIPLKRPYRIAFKATDQVEISFVLLHTDTQSIGIGAASPSEYVTKESANCTYQTLHNFTQEWPIQANIRYLPAIIKELALTLTHTPAACAALDMAMYDLYGKMLNLPVVDILGRTYQTLPTSITVGICSLEETLAQLAEHYQTGFRYFKIKTGNDVSQDIERLAKIRECYKNTIHIRVDANQGYTVAQLNTFLAATASWDIELIEQPFKVGDEHILNLLPSELRKLIALDESCLNSKTALQLLQTHQASGIFNIKLMKCGGIHDAYRWAELAQLADISLMWGCNDESCISISAALHCALACTATRFLDLDGSLDLANDFANGGFLIDNAGYMRTVDKPGLGIEWR